MTSANQIDGVPSVVASMNYLSPDSHINRRYFGPGFEINTAISAWRDMPIHNGRGQGLTLDRNGFQLLDVPSKVDIAGFISRLDASKLENGVDIKDEDYAKEVCQTIANLTGAKLVLPLNAIARTSNETLGSSQPPAGDIHVDMNGVDAARNAKRFLELHGVEGLEYSRFLCTSFWRPISAPPQDMPLALCDWQTVADDEGRNNQFIFAQTPPDLDNLPEFEPEDANMPTGSLFVHSDAHRWYYFPDMAADEAILLKLHDSDHSRAWRTPHTAFADPSVNVDHSRESIEFRTIAYFD